MSWQLHGYNYGRLFDCIVRGLAMHVVSLITMQLLAQYEDSEERPSFDELAAELEKVLSTMVDIASFTGLDQRKDLQCGLGSRLHGGLRVTENGLAI